MQLETFRGPELRLVVQQIRLALGEDAMIVRTRVVRGADGDEVEVIAARPEDIEALKERLDGGHAAAVRAKGRKKVGPYVVALVGPGGRRQDHQPHEGRAVARGAWRTGRWGS